MDEIRSKARAERAAVSALDGQITDSYLKQQMLKHASFLLDDVELFLIPRALQARNARDLSMWLRIARLTLQLATQQRQTVQHIVDKYGPNAQSIDAD